MAKFCSECGFSLEAKVNFCPNCGKKITEIVSPNENIESKNSDTVTRVVIICDNCGDENLKDVDFCNTCGVALKGEERIVKSDGSESKVNLNKSKTVHSKKTKSSKKPAGSKNHNDPGITEKSLDPKKIYLISSTVLILVFVILLSSGVFDSGPVVSNVNQNQTQTQNNSGVDLNNLSTINELEAKVKANPSDFETLLHLAHLQNDSRMYDKAIQTYKKYLESNPQNADARVDMGICYYNLSDYPTAINEMETALKYQPKHQIAHLNLGIVNLTAGNVQKSKEWFQKAIDINPDSDIGKRAQELLKTH